MGGWVRGGGRRPRYGPATPGVGVGYFWPGLSSLMVSVPSSSASSFTTTEGFLSLGIVCRVGVVAVWLWWVGGWVWVLGKKEASSHVMDATVVWGGHWLCARRLRPPTPQAPFGARRRCVRYACAGACGEWWWRVWFCTVVYMRKRGRRQPEALQRGRARSSQPELPR